jgi:hypothetical protein
MPPRLQANAAGYPDRIFGFKIFGGKEDRGVFSARISSGSKNGIDEKFELVSRRSI